MRMSASTGEVFPDGSITCWGVTSTMKIARHFTIDGATPYQGIEFRTTASEIKNPDGSVVFSHTGIEVPADWSQVACDVLAQKYFRRAGVPARLKSVEENTVPSFLWRHIPDETAL